MAFVDESWLEAYTNALQRDKSANKAPPGVGCCPICCTFFSLFGAFVLFIIAALMNNNYPYLHIAGDERALSKHVAVAGIIYIIFALLSIGCWVRAAIKAGAFARADAFTQLQS